MHTSYFPSTIRVAIICAIALLILAVQVALFYFLWSPTSAIICAIIEVPVLAWMVYEIVRAPIMEDAEGE